MADERTKQPREILRESQNPGGSGFPDIPGQETAERGRNVSGETAERAGERALGDHPFSRGEIMDQSAYAGSEADAGEQAADAERARRDEEPPRERIYPGSKP